MARLALRLRLRLLRGSLRGGPGSTARIASLLLGAAGGALLAVVGLLLLTQLRGPDLQAAAVLLFSALLLSWLVLPILTFAGDDLMDPSRLALLPLTRRQLATVLAVGAAVGVAPVATLLACAGLVLSAGSLPAALVAAVAVTLQVALCVSASRLVAALLSGLLRSRRGRDLGVALSALAAVSVQLVNPLLQRLDGTGTQVHVLLADRLAATPPALLASAPALVREGRTGSAVLRLLLVAGLVALLVLAWQAATARAMTSPDRTSTRRPPRRTRLPRLLPAGRVGAVAGKDLRYSRREPRRLSGLVIASLLPLVALLGPVLTYGVSRNTVFAICGAALLAGTVGANRFGLDGTATWLVLASQRGLPGARRDLLGGDLASVLLLTPFLVLSGVGVSAVAGTYALLPAALGLAGALLGVGLGLSGLVAVLAPYTVPEDRGSTFGNGASALAVGLTFAQLLAVPLLCLPLLPLLLAALDGPGAAYALLVLGPVYGLAVGAGLREAAARTWVRRGPEVLAMLVGGRA